MVGRKRSPFPGDAKTPNPILSYQPPASTVSLYGELFSEYFGKMNVVSVILEGNEFAPSLVRECIVPRNCFSSFSVEIFFSQFLNVNLCHRNICKSRTDTVQIFSKINSYFLKSWSELYAQFSIFLLYLKFHF